jgi:hypothetical protein
MCVDYFAHAPGMITQLRYITGVLVPSLTRALVESREHTRPSLSRYNNIFPTGKLSN